MRAHPVIPLRMPDRGGQALVEFALVIPLVLLLFMLVIDFGRAIYGYNAVSNAARMGVRTAIVNQYIPAIKQRAADQATALGIDPVGDCSGTSGVCVAIKTSDLNSNCALTPSGQYPLNCVAIVTVKYTFRAVTPLIGNLVGAIPITSTSTQQIESSCLVASCPVP